MTKNIKQKLTNITHQYGLQTTNSS